MKSDDQMHKVDLAVALVAAALCETNPLQSAAGVRQARAVFDSLPAEARAMRSSRLVEALITQAARRAG
jgi:hypothetical protein